MDSHHMDSTSGVRMKRLPFYDVIVNLLKPTRLVVTTSSKPGVQKGKLAFSLASWQTKVISKLRDPASNLQFHVILRFCEFNSNQTQADLCPQDFGVKINRIQVLQSQRKCTKKSFPLPLDITNEFIKTFLQINNTIRVSWREDNEACNGNLAVSICLVKRLTANDLIKRVPHSGLECEEDDDMRNVKNLRTEEDHERSLCTPTSIRVSLICPLAKIRMTYPCRATTCKHLQCFDAKQFLLLNEKKPTFICPVCDEILNFEDLRIDRFFDLVIKKFAKDGTSNEIEIFPDGHWRQVINRKVKQAVASWGSVIPAKSIRTEKLQENYIDLESGDGDMEFEKQANKEVSSSLEELELVQRKTIKVEPTSVTSDEEEDNTINHQEKTANICDAKSFAINDSDGTSSGNTELSSVSLKNVAVVSNSTKTLYQYQPSPQSTPICTFRRNGVKELEYLSKLLKVPFSFTNFALENDYLSFVTLSTNPPHMAHSHGQTIEEARDIAALKLLEEFTFPG